MLDMIVELENGKSYLILDECILKDIKYYFGVRLDENDEPTNNYLFFSESNNGGDIYLDPVSNDELKNILLTSFTVSFLEKVYDDISL